MYGGGQFGHFQDACLLSMSSSLGIHIILHLPAEFVQIVVQIRDIVMTSYPLFKIVATASQFYFRFRFSWPRSFRKVEIHLQTKFRRDISIRCSDITTSSFWKQTFAMLEFYFRFRFSCLRHHWMSFCVRLPNFVKELWRHIQYPRWWPQSRNSTSGFALSNSANLERSKSTCRPNFGKKS